MADKIDRIRIDRRTTIKWLAATMAVAHTGCSHSEKNVGDEIPPMHTTSGPLLGEASPINGTGYGTDPDMMNPSVPWSRTMTDEQIQAATSLCDMIIPADEHSPEASAVGVPDFIDEWISAPYDQQQSDREYILAGIEWLEQISRREFGAGFTDISDEQRAKLIDPIAIPGESAENLSDQIEFFRRFRFLTVGSFYSSDAGMKDVGYVGNVAIAGEYPGPSDEAMVHLAGVLERLDLSLST